MYHQAISRMMVGVWLAATPCAWAAGADPVEQGRATIRAMLKSYEAARSFQGCIKVETRLRDKVDIVRMNMWLEKPYGVSFKVLSSSAAPGTAGSKVVWFGEPNCDVKTSLFGLPIKLSTSCEDPRLAGPRGWTLRETSVRALMRMVEDPRTTFRSLGMGKAAGRTMNLVEARGPALLKGLQREVLYIDDKPKLPFGVEGWDGEERALRLEVESFAFDAPMDPMAFKLD